LLAPKPFAKRARTKLDDIADALKGGARYEDLQSQIDSFLGPLETVRDERAEEEWEINYRRGKE
jgi:hypothetical protein